jgi:cysteinyl-tRNA synthetase
LADVTGDGTHLETGTAECERLFGDAMDDDLNVSAALAAVFDFVRTTNKLIDDNDLSTSGAANAAALLDRLNAVTGLFPLPDTDTVPEDVMALVRERGEARRAKDFPRADAIRDQLLDAGWVIEDTPDGPRVKRN